MTGDDEDRKDDRTVFQPPSGAGGEIGPPVPPPGGPQYPPPGAPQAPSGGDPFAPLGTGGPPAAPPDPFGQVTPAPAAPAGSTGQIRVGDVLNGIYRITRFIARGGMGEVYEGVNVHSPSDRVAIKVILSNLASDELVMAMFDKEAATLTRLHHEAIVPYRLTSRDLQGRPFIVTEFVDGPSLEERLGSVRLTDEQFGGLARRLARGLGAAHSLGAIHRDIAPDNILLVDGDPERPKIIDFGIARDAREQTQTIVGDGFAGKLKYVAPEQLGEYGRNIGPWTDLYSLALTLLAVASGRHTDMGGSIADAVRKRMSVPDLSAIPAKYRPAFERALQPDPAMRPQSMSDFIALLHEAEDRGGTGFLPMEDRPRTFTPTSPPRGGADGGGTTGLSAKLPKGMPGGKWTLIGAAGALVLVLGLVGIVIATSSDEEEPIERAEGAGAGEGPAAAVEPGTPQFTMLASSLASQQPCSWLTFDGANGGVARFVGGAGNPAGAQNAIADGLAGKGAADISLDMGEVVSFNQTMCDAVDALREFRARGDLVTSPQRTYEVEDQVIPIQGGSLQGRYAKPLFRIEGLQPGDDIVLLVIEANNGMKTLFAGRDNAKTVVDLLLGTVTPDGYEIPYPADLESPPKESYGIAVVTGRGPFSTQLFGDAEADQPLPLDASWPDRFRSEARAKGWRTDIFWFSVADEVPG
ncbi:serine/threonine-protein kinase [Tsuneonella sp. SYSU-LHT278]|uniref:serine/threonine-protein kinase n=1 Tax=Tsuneonella sediminis TaxID=3416089 RepID=UPI003F7A1753